METTQLDPPQARPPRRRLAFANQKGGVGKTLITLLVAAAAAKAELRVLVCDFDPQANATRKLLGEQVQDGTAALMSGQPALVRTSVWPGVDVLGSSLDLAKADMDGSIDGPYRANSGLEALTAGYDLVLFDMPPSLGRLLAAGLIAADGLVLVTDASDDGLQGIANVIESFETVRSNHMNRRDIELLGIIVNRYKRSGEQDYRESELREAYGDLVLPGHLTDRSGIPEAHAAQLTVYDHSNAGARVGAAYADQLLQLLSERAGITLPATDTTTAEEATR